MKTAVIVSTMGGPSGLNEVEGFLFNLFYDPAILRVPVPIRFLLAKMIAKKRAPTAKKIYEKMGGASPILENTKRQAKALENALRERGDYKCFVGMSYSKPFIKDAIKAAKNEGFERFVILPMYPQYSTTTTASVLCDAKKQFSKSEREEVSIIESFHDSGFFVQSTAQIAKSHAEKAADKKNLVVLFSAHGLPESVIKAGDPYAQQCENTGALIASEMNLEATQWVVCYQSRVGPQKWIGPETEVEVRRAAGAGKSILVVPIAFVCEHAETLVELNIEYRQKAMEWGAAFYEVARTVGEHTVFIEGLAAHIHKINQKRGK